MRHGDRRPFVGETPQGERRLGLRRRQHFEGDVGDDGERAPGAGHQLGQIVTGHVLHHPPAGLPRLAAPRNGMDAEDMVARGARLDAPWTGKICRQRAADRAHPGCAAEQRPIVQRLEGQLLVVLGKQRLDLGQWRAGPGRKHQFLRLVKRDARQPRQVERMLGLRRPADPALGAVAQDLQRGVVCECPLHGGENLCGGGGCEDGHP
jgi:hypothetical protein